MLRVVALLVVGLQVAEAAPKPGDFVDVSALIPDAVIDIRYATKENFTGEVLYPVARCKLRRSVAERLVKVAAVLRKKDRRLLLWDCYRPLSIQKALWKKVPDPRYVADPKTGSQHNRGAAIDLAVVDKDGKPVVLPTRFDDFSEAAHRKRALAGTKGREAKQLSDAMESAGFVGIATEWWHFDASNAGTFDVSNDPL